MELYTEPALDATTTTNIITAIPIHKIATRALRCNPTNQQEFAIGFAINAVEMFIDKFAADDRVGFTHRIRGAGRRKSKRNRTGKRTRKTKSRKGRTRRTKKRRTSIRGGAPVKFVLFFIVTILAFVQSLRGVSHEEVVSRLKDAISSIDIFKNEYGTCAANTLLFLKSIDLPTFGDLSLRIMTFGHGMNQDQVEAYLNKDIAVTSSWFSFTGRRSSFAGSSSHINRFIDTVRNKLVEMRRLYGFSADQEILTFMAYPGAQGASNHAVTAWLTNTNDVIIIDPQEYYESNRIRLYSSKVPKNSNRAAIMDSDSDLALYPLSQYIEENVDVASTDRATFILTSIHAEIEDPTDQNRLSPSNPELQRVIGMIRDKEESMSTSLSQTP